MPAPGQPIDEALAQALRHLRVSRGGTQEGIAIEAGIRLSTYGRIELGQSSPAWVTVRQIADALDVSLVELARAVEREEG